MATLTDWGKRIFGNDRGFAKQTVGSRSQTSAVRHGTAQEASESGYVTVLIDGSEEPVTLVCEVPVVKNQRVSVASNGGTYKVVSVGQVVEMAADAKNSAVISVTEEFAESDSAATAPESGWSTDSPSWTEGETVYIWRRITTVYGNGNVETGEPSCVLYGTGADGKSAYELAREAGFEGTEDEWLQSLVGQDGENGLNGENGKNGLTTYVHIAYATDGSGSNFRTTWFEGTTHLGTCTSFTEDDPTTASLYTWALIKGEDGQDGNDGYTPVKGKDYFDGEDGNDGYTPVKGKDYFDGEDGYTPVKGKDYFDGADGKSAYQLALDNGFEGTEAEWLASLVGRDGTDGENGTAGTDGKTPYLHIAYGTSLSGANFSTTYFEGATHMGTCTDYTKADPTTASSYTWALIKGSDGKDGEDGTDGEDGVRGTGIYRVTTAPSGYTTPAGGFTPTYRIDLSTVLTQSGATEILVGDQLRYSYYLYPVGYVDSSDVATRYVYLGARTSIRGAAGASGQMLYATSSTDADTAAKVATLASGSLTLAAGATVSVKFTYANTAANPTLNVGSTGAKPISTNGVTYAYWEAGATVIFTYSGSGWYVCSSPVYASEATVGNPAGGNVYIDGDSVDIRNGENVLATFGETTQIGDSSDNVQISSNGVQFVNNGENGLRIFQQNGTAVLRSSYMADGGPMTLSGDCVAVSLGGTQGYVSISSMYGPILFNDREVYGAKVLYSEPSGTNGKVGLNESAANFSYLDIIFGNGEGRVSGTTRVHSPNGKAVEISANLVGTNGFTNIYFARYTISETSMALSINTALSASLNGDWSVMTNYLYVMAVIGYA